MILPLTPARRLAISSLPIGAATTWTPTGTRDALSALLGTYLVHASAADAAAHCVRHTGARILSSTEGLSAADEAWLMAEARARLTG